ncbi:hypothetical protein GUITHDRAFT_150357 [Guillardia theta CCMP2712]|uniref:Uncharacterized protein n=1 Tax=Guillardia theta (strain CCMP2712) TaxID=905079 RepID=L1JY43_GUITC|nr:hypothetical protein GUITHDRAFT_150357 [Guillardia theta CCMP2712]EKX53262.1 hypothetical protein GUITHDRAFT_150357 [Guillardia theta CCMP2712]|mmetsp:Transcript_10817/g.36405  ORF Transcript_10817/g.36405 Transcript_10817/m.36405 type:complete len:87 (+) Transcript_10817:217-477(+)|eukprot:XP_005840242.1 hypothetical protein GUITHDRAFT_150357 [Guillardia theta CCMP2712]
MFWQRIVVARPLVAQAINRRMLSSALSQATVTATRTELHNYQQASKPSLAAKNKSSSEYDLSSIIPLKSRSEYKEIVRKYNQKRSK